MKRRANDGSTYKLPIELPTAIFALSLLSSRNRDGNYHSSLRLLRLMSFYWSRAFDDTHRLWTIVDSRGFAGYGYGQRKVLGPSIGHGTLRDIASSYLNNSVQGSYRRFGPSGQYALPMKRS